MLSIYHNPRCRKSRETLEIIEKSGKEVNIVEYLNDVPTQNELKDILNKLGMKAEQIVRRGEPVFKEQFKGKTYSEVEWLKVLVENPKLIERPIVVKGDKAVIGRPPENVNELL